MKKKIENYKKATEAIHHEMTSFYEEINLVKKNLHDGFITAREALKLLHEIGDETLTKLEEIEEKAKAA